MFRMSTVHSAIVSNKIDERKEGRASMSSISEMKIGLPSPGIADEKISFIGSRPAFLANQAMVEAIPRKSISPPLPKVYQGFDRVCQSLRHIATSVNWGMIKFMSCRPVEVQVSVINGKLHISSNFHHEHIAQALHFALTMDADNAMPYPGEGRSKLLVEEARNRRHIANLKKVFLSENKFLELKEKIISDIANGLGYPAKSNLAHQEVETQAVAALNVLHEVIRNASLPSPTFEHLVIHPPFRDDHLDGALPEGIGQTMHAEQNIQRALASDKDRQYLETRTRFSLQEGQHIIIPIAGKFVPCVACSEVEHEAKGSGGLFDPEGGKFILHRSSQRIGMAFWNEVQHIAVESLNIDQEKALEKGIAIRDRFYNQPEKLQAAHREMVEDYSFDTDSACSDDD